jgi:hypothetical protein
LKVRTRSVIADDRSAAAVAGACQLTLALGGGQGSAGPGAAAQMPAPKSHAINVVILNIINLLKFIIDQLHR